MNTTTEPKAVALQLPDGTPAGVYLCPTCRLATADEAWSAKHCVCRACGVPIDGRRGYPRCDACERAERARQDAARMERAEKLESWGGWVWWDGHGGNNGYFESVGDFVEFLEGEYDDPEDWPEFVYLAERREFPGLDLGRILENLCDDLYEDAADDLSGTDELNAAINAFNAANAHVVTYDGTYKRAVRVPRPDKPDTP